MRIRCLFLATTLSVLTATSLYGIQLAPQWFSGSDPTITFETGSTALPGISGLQLSGGDATFACCNIQCFGSQYFGNLNGASYLDIYFAQPQQAVGAYIIDSSYYSTVEGVREVVYDQSNNIIEAESALFPTWGSSPVFLGIGEPTAQIYRVEWQYINGGYFGVDNVVYGGANGLSQMPNIPTSLNATLQSGTVLLNWTASDRATSYNVKRANTSNGSYAIVGNGVAGTTYTDTTVTNGATYYYVVTAVNPYGESAASHQVTAFIVDHFAFAPVASPQTSSVPFTVSVNACDINGNVLSNFTGAAMLSGTGDRGNVPFTPTSTTAFVNGKWNGTITLDPAYPDTNIRLAANSNSVSGLSNPFNAIAPAIQLFNLTMADLAYNPFNQILYAAVPANAGTYSNCLIAIDPVMGRVVNTFYLGNDPIKVTASGDGQFLYVGFRGTNAFGRFNLTSNTLDFLSSLGMDNYYGLLYHANQLAVLPGQPRSVAIAVNTGFGDASEVLIFDDEVERSNIFGGLASSSGTVIAASDTRLYAGAPFTRMSVDQTGIVSSDSHDGLVGLYDLLKYQQGFGFTPSGEVFNPETLAISGILTNCSILEPDLAAGRIFAMGSHPVFAQPDAWTMYSWNSSNLQMVATLPVPGVLNSPLSLIRWGTNGLAFCNANQFFLIRTLLVPNVRPVLASESSQLPGEFQLNFSGDQNYSYRVWASTNLRNWILIGSPSLVSNGWFWFSDLTATNYPCRYYRLSTSQ